MPSVLFRAGPGQFEIVTSHFEVREAERDIPSKRHRIAHTYNFCRASLGKELCFMEKVEDTIY
eukprot:1157342-Pelagomonas_calceolata.AAC.8